MSHVRENDNNFEDSPYMFYDVRRTTLGRGEGYFGLAVAGRAGTNIKTFRRVKDDTVKTKLPPEHQSGLVLPRPYVFFDSGARPVGQGRPTMGSALGHSWTGCGGGDLLAHVWHNNETCKLLEP